MDGNNRTAIHSTNLQTPYALAIDYATQTLFWADYALNRLESSRTDGSNRRILSMNLQGSYAMSFFAGKLYWTNLISNSIYSTLSSTPNSAESVLTFNRDVYDIHIIDERLQYEGTIA